MINISMCFIRGGLFALFFLGSNLNSFSQKSFLRDTGVVAGQPYRTWAVGAQAGVLSPVIFTGGTNDFTNWDTGFGYSFNIRKQVSPVVALQANLLKGEFRGSNTKNGSNEYRAFETRLSYAADARIMVNLGSMSFLRRDRNLQFNLAAGAGRMAYSPVLVRNDFSREDWSVWGREKTETAVYFPVALGAKFRLSNVVSFNVNYQAYFADSDFLDGLAKNGASSKDKFSYGSAGLEITLGKFKNRDLSWVNPIALLYDNLNYEKEQEDLRVLKEGLLLMEYDIKRLQSDEDGDGISDFYDKCPGTVRGVVVDGAGCPIVTPSEILELRKKNEGVRYVDVELRKVSVE